MTNGLDLRVDHAVAHEVAAAYLDATDRREPLAVTAFAQLVKESDRLFRWITGPDRLGVVQVVFTRCETPYRDAHELVQSVRDFRTLEVTTVAAHSDRRHPAMGNEIGGAYDRFRAVHDVLGQARMNAVSVETASLWCGWSRNDSIVRSRGGRSVPNCMASTVCGGPLVRSPNRKRYCWNRRCCATLAEGVAAVNLPPANESDDELQFLQDMVEENASIAGDVLQVGETSGPFTASYRSTVTC